jgi:hypothetical protein
MVSGPRDAQIKFWLAATTVSFHAIRRNSGRIFGLSWDLTRPVWVQPAWSVRG